MIWPDPHGDVDPVAVYADDERVGVGGRPWLLANMIATADGSAADADGRSGGLGGPADKDVFAAIRGVADVIVAGAATVVTENYGSARPPAAVRDRRLARGQSPAARIAVVTAALSIEPGHRLFRDAPADAGPLVLTVEQADAGRRRALEAVAEVHTVGDTRVDWARALDVLRSATGATVVLCEGGPHTIGQLVADDLLDELSLTVAPTLVGGDGPRIAVGPRRPGSRPLTLDRVLVADDYLFLRYLRQRAG
jgi:riboflavin biosynthesis pyrimidine reductase